MGNLNKIVLDDETLEVEDTKARTDIGDVSELQTDTKDNIVEAVNECFQYASDGKTLIASAITGKGVATSADATFATMATNIGSIRTGIDTSEATATAADILAGKTAGVGDAIITGTMEKKTGTTWWCGYETVALQAHPSAPDQGVVTIPNTYNQPGYYDATSAVSGNIANLNAGNIRAGIPVGQSGGDSTNCIIGTFTADATAGANHILYGQTAYVNGAKVTGSMPNYDGTNQPTGGVWTDGSSLVGFANANSGYYPGGNASGIIASYASVANAIGLTADKILTGNTICGVTGTAISGKRYATGTVTMSGESLTSERFMQVGWGGPWNGVEAHYSICYFTLDGLSFTPSAIRVSLSVMNYPYIATMFVGQKFCVLECTDGIDNDRYGLFNTRESMFTGTKVYLPVSANFLDSSSSSGASACTYIAYE